METAGFKSSSRGGPGLVGTGGHVANQNPASGDLAASGEHGVALVVSARRADRGGAGPRGARYRAALDRACEARVDRRRDDSAATKHPPGRCCRRTSTPAPMDQGDRGFDGQFRAETRPATSTTAPVDVRLFRPRGQ